MTEETRLEAVDDPTKTEPQEAPALTPEDQLTQEQIEWRSKERLAFEADVRKEYQKQVDDARKELDTKLRAENEKAFKEVVDSWKKAQTPPTAAEVQALLDGEFPEFPVTVKIGGKEERGTIRELGAAYERKFIRLLREKAPKHFDIISAAILDFAAGQSAEDKLMAVLKSAETMSDLIAEASALVLSAAIGREFKVEEIDNNFSTTRQVLILRAQFDANRLRDFFSHGSRLLKA